MFYPYPEFEAKILRENINDWGKYEEARAKDPKLPSVPNLHYANFRYYKRWTTLRDKIWKRKKKEFYSYSQFKDKLIKDEICSISMYKEARAKDSKLPSSPKDMYCQWKGFRWVKKKIKGRRRKGLGFYTIDELKDKMNRENILTREKYIEARKKDNKIPSDPARRYGKEWTGFIAIRKELNKHFYPYDIFEFILLKNNITNRKKYEEKAKNDSRMPSSPHSYEEWKGFGYFVEKIFQKHNEMMSFFQSP